MQLMLQKNIVLFELSIYSSTQTRLKSWTNFALKPSVLLKYTYPNYISAALVTPSIKLGLCTRDRDSYLRAWEQKIDKTYGKNEEKALPEIHRYFYKHKLWEYNQIVGYIVVSVEPNDFQNSIKLHIFLDKPKYNASKKVATPSNTRFNRSAFPAIECREVMSEFEFVFCYHTENQLKREIKDWVERAIKKYVYGSLYVERALFDATIECTNVKKLIKLRRQQYKSKTDN